MSAFHRHRLAFRLALVCLAGFTSARPLGVRAAAADAVEVWVTTADLQSRMSTKPPLTLEPIDETKPASIRVDASKTFQTLLGLGSSLEGTTCSNLVRIPPADRERVMKRLVSPTEGIGMNLMRLCIGTSDFTGDPWYSYSDLPPGETDPELRRFSIDRDRAYLLPMIQLARRCNPDLLFFASPWSPPGWMKSNGSLIGGTLLPQWYAAYARYFVRFIQAYEAEGIPIHAVTVQNEPGVDRAKEKDRKWHYPSCRWTGEQERDFIRDHLGPALRQAGLKTRIWCYDHNYNLTTQGDDPGLPYPRTILQDAAAASFVDGVAFHGYVGQPTGMSIFHREFPEKTVHFTEGSVFGIWGARDLIERLRNDASSYNAWVCILDDKGRPNNGPFPATHAILKLDSESLTIEELFEYHAYGQFMKFLPRGSLRIGCTTGDEEVTHVAFRVPDGSRVLIAVNTTERPRTLGVQEGGRCFRSELGPKSIATFRWPAP